MTDLGPLFRFGAEPQTLRYSFEKAGLTLDGQPIPWNADAVIVESVFKLASAMSRRPADYCLRLVEDETTVPVESLSVNERGDSCRLSFRFSPPRAGTLAELFHKHRSLGQLTLPVLSRQEFCKRLGMELCMTAVKLGDQVIACETFVGAQCQGIVASAVFTSPTSLVPLADLALTLEARSAKTGAVHRAPVQLASSQLKSRKAVVSAVLPKPRTTGTWQVSWKLGDRELGSQRLRAISKPQFLRSLRLLESRFIVQTRDGDLRAVLQLPPSREIVRLGPCFVLVSNETGMAGLCKVQVRAAVKGAVQPPLLQEHEVLISDGPLPLAPGTVDAADLGQLEGFELRAGGVVLGHLSVLPVPAGRFTTEGGFKPPPDFAWSSAAEEQLSQRLRKLLG